MSRANVVSKVTWITRGRTKDGNDGNQFQTDENDQQWTFANGSPPNPDSTESSCRCRRSNRDHLVSATYGLTLEARILLVGGNLEP